MQICPECGGRNAADAQFCSSCGTFLAWEDEQSPPRSGPSTPGPVPEPGPPPPPPRPEPPSRPGRGPTHHNPQKVRKLPADPAEQDPVEQDDRTVALPRLPDGVPGPGHRSSTPSPPDGTGRVGSSSVRGPESVPPSREPPPVPPGDTRATPPRPAEHEPERLLAPGEVACPRCGAGNSPDRHFCRRCAMELRQDAPRAAPQPSRPPREGRSPLVWVLVVLVALLVLWFLVALFS